MASSTAPPRHSSGSAGVRPATSSRDGSALDKTALCKFFAKRRCSRGKDCSFAHSELELQPQMDLYKTQFCTEFLGQGSCWRGAECKFAHGAQDLRAPRGTWSRPAGAALRAERGVAPRGTLRVQLEELALSRTSSKLEPLEESSSLACTSAGQLSGYETLCASSTDSLVCGEEEEEDEAEREQDDEQATGRRGALAEAVHGLLEASGLQLAVRHTFVHVAAAAEAQPPEACRRRSSGPCFGSAGHMSRFKSRVLCVLRIGGEKIWDENDGDKAKICTTLGIDEAEWTEGLDKAAFIRKFVG